MFFLILLFSTSIAICLITLIIPTLSKTFDCHSLYANPFTICEVFGVVLNPSDKLQLKAPANLKRLILCLGNISKIPQDLFNTFPKLNILELDATGLEDLDGGFVNATQITEFNSVRNNVKVLRNHGFVGSESLRKLSLRNNSLETIEDEAFSGLGQLENLFLDNNKIVEINPKWFEPLKNIVHLDLCKNQIENINEVCFRNNLKLQVLNLKDNFIISINPSNFCYSRKLEQIFLLGNECYEFTRNSNSYLQLGIDRCVNAYFETVEYLRVNKSKYEYYECFMKNFEGHAMHIYSHIFEKFHVDASLKLQKLYRNQHWLLDGLFVMVVMMAVGIVATVIFVKTKFFRSNKPVQMSHLIRKEIIL